LLAPTLRTRPGTITLRCEDRLGNLSLQTINIAAATEVQATGLLDAAVTLSERLANSSRTDARILLRVKERATLALSICDAQGRIVRHLRKGPLGPGAVQIPWDGRDDSGNPVGGGSHFVRLETGGRILSSRLVGIS
jgi:flagellar hook assembly protein FlgD